MRESAFPEKLDVGFSIESETRLFRMKRPRLFLVGTPFTIEGSVRNSGTTPIPAHAPVGYKWSLSLRIRWADGRVTTFPLYFEKQLQPQETLMVGPLRTTVVAPGFFSGEIEHPYEELRFDDKGNQMGGLSGSKTIWLFEKVAVDMSALRTRWLLWISIATLLAVLFGVLLSLRGR